jgi:hypothetical protein
MPKTFIRTCVKSLVCVDDIVKVYRSNDKKIAQIFLPATESEVPIFSRGPIRVLNHPDTREEYARVSDIRLYDKNLKIHNVFLSDYPDPDEAWEELIACIREGRDFFPEYRERCQKVY